ncbi:efflux transporter outer membrane subunit [Luteolibacter sp. GHJ8]|uniref:Efflux transporter outer membrane subunit n=1 Tax=Luteolibacter rhizosphaerae TaxID=2989719 RepID=A0ABT3GAK1_9BACT|nr:efflux transporter outer membrane subunit [Luteolibacter rhizosphaerae]MCW1916863.1 efflux transporter outer membrane subunit [Luteolibacter rhizosphaerae]
MRKPHLIALTFPVLLGSCNLEPKLEGVNSPVPENYPGNSGGSVSADIAWNKFISDPRLKRLVKMAIDNNRDLRVAALNVEATRAQYGITRSALFPTVNVGAGGSRSRQPGALGTGTAIESRAYEVSVGVTSYELDIFGRVRSQSNAALQEYFASDAARVGVQISLVAEVANAYFNQRAAIEQINLAQQTLDAVSETYDLTQKRFDAGDVSELDLRSVDIQVQTAKAQLAAYRQRVSETNNALAVLIGAPVPSSLPEGRSLEGALVAEVRAGVSSDLLRRRPDILEAEHQLKGANANIGAARAAFFPRITLTGSAGTASRSLGDLFQSGSSAWAFSPQVSVPIFDGGLNKANLDLAQVRKQIEIASYEKTIQTAFREVADGLAARTGLAGQIEAYQSLVAAQQKRFELADARYRQGVDSYFEVLTAQQDLFESRQALIQLRLARAVNSIGLYKALGGGW